MRGPCHTLCKYIHPLSLIICIGSVSLTQDLLPLGANLPLPGRSHHVARVPPLWGAVCPRGGHHLHLSHPEWAAAGGTNHPLLAWTHAPRRAVQYPGLPLLPLRPQRLLWFVCKSAQSMHSDHCTVCAVALIVSTCALNMQYCIVDCKLTEHKRMYAILCTCCRIVWTFPRILHTLHLYVHIHRWLLPALSWVCVEDSPHSLSLMSASLPREVPPSLLCPSLLCQTTQGEPNV